jgi:hypothetical protein
LRGKENANAKEVFSRVKTIGEAVVRKSISGMRIEGMQARAARIHASRAREVNRRMARHD